MHPSLRIVLALTLILPVGATALNAAAGATPLSAFPRTMPSFNEPSLPRTLPSFNQPPAKPAAPAPAPKPPSAPAPKPPTGLVILPPAPAPASPGPVAASGELNGYPRYEIRDDGRHLAPQAHPTQPSRGAITLVHQGVRYTGYFHIPANPTGPLPLIVTIHGVYQKGAEAYMNMQPNTGVRRYATLDVDATGGSWNAGRCCGEASAQNLDSNGGIMRLIQEFNHAHAYNPSRLYAAGFSNGGMMAYALACNNPGKFAAIAVVAGAHVTPCRPSKPVHVLHIHGTADAKVPYNGINHSPSLHTRLPSVADTTNLWRTLNAPHNVTTTTITLNGLGHSWPGQANSGYDATDQIQVFLLKRHL